MNSCLYECRVMHARLGPRRHSFCYRLFYFALDLDELETIARRLTLFSVGRTSVYSFRDADFLPTTQPPAGTLKDRVIAHAARHGVNLHGGRILLVTLPRILGYLFNPVSFYFCYDRQGRPAGAIAEVTNTFREVKPYFLAADRNAAATDVFRLRVPKHFYVSPYSDVDVEFDFTLRCPGETFSVQIDDYVGRQRTLTSRVTGARHALTSGRLAWFTIKYPLLTIRVMTLIHWHALQLWLKRVPWFPKAARASDQRDLLRPHRSLQPPNPA